jgi:PPK2 family polyphosphate:nucleotide phosphotransferase
MKSLSEISTRAPNDLDKAETKEKLVDIREQLQELQHLFFAEGKRSLLVVIQGMDASGKDGLIRSVFSCMNPMGVSVRPFKAPTEEELSHDFLWRIHRHAPAKGMIQVFNRSHYEDILITRVHKLVDDDTARKRMKAINDFEQLLAEHNNTTILKFYLHISPGEQKERLEERLDDKTKQWKYNEADFKEAKRWDDYMAAYEDCLQHCNKIPWTIVPSDQNWYKEYLVATSVLETLKNFDMKFPPLKK